MKTSTMLKTFLCVVTLFVASENLFAQWTSAGSVVSPGTYPSVSVVNQNTAWIAGGPNGNPRVFLTTDGGTTWATLGAMGLFALEVYCVWGVNATTAYVGNGGVVGGAGGNAKFFLTANAGTEWTVVDSTGGTGGFYNGIVFSKIVPTFGIAQSDPPTGAGQPYYVAKTTNGGTTWTRTSPPGIAGAASAVNSVFVIDQNFYGFGLNAAPPRVYITNDGGTNWYIGNLGLAGAFVSSVAFKDDKVFGLAGTSADLPNIARTTNGGVNWSVVSAGTGITGTASLKWVSGSNTCYLAGTSSVKKSTDAGATWTTMTTPAISGIWHLELVRSGSNAYAYAVSTTGAVIKLADVVTTVDPTVNLPERYNLSQNYPNPFNPSTRFTYSLPVRSTVKLAIFDMLGREIRVLLNNEVREAGSYEREWDGMNDGGRVMPSGTYFIRLQSGGYIKTRKIALVK